MRYVLVMASMLCDLCVVAKSVKKVWASYILGVDSGSEYYEIGGVTPSSLQKVGHSSHVNLEIVECEPKKAPKLTLVDLRIAQPRTHFDTLTIGAVSVCICMLHSGYVHMYG